MVSVRRARYRRALVLAAVLVGVMLLVPLGARRDVPLTDAPDAVHQVIRFGVVSFYNPRLMYLKYQPLVDYLNTHTPWHVELDLQNSYDETVEGLCSGRLQLAYLGPFTYLRAQEACGARVAVRLNTRGLATFQSYIMVRQDSPFRSLADLANTRFGFGSVMSTSSHLVPRVMLERAGLRPGTNVACDYFGHHERAARGVLMGEVSACGVRDIVGDLFKDRGLRVLARSDPLPNFPLAVARNAPAGFEEALVSALVDLPRRDPRVGRLFASWDDELSSGFARGGTNDYAPIKTLATGLFGPRSLTLPIAALACGPER